ncbi:MAG: lipoyl(octanoyl) transferase LipB [Candidatus Krumholzibacteriia bacterium]
MGIETVSATSAGSETSAWPLCEVQRLGVVPYARALGMQAELVRLRAANRIADRLLLLEHPHVLTLGRNGQDGHVLAERRRLRGLGVELFETGRGGDVTYHGPGQLVAYPILDLRPDRCDLHRYVRDLERVMLRVLEDWDLQGHVVPGRTGVWVKEPAGLESKVGAIGVRVSRWITSHGIALNVHTNLRYFDLIVPCGLEGSAVTSIAELLGRAPSVDAVARRFAFHFGAILERRMRDVMSS